MSTYTEEVADKLNAILEKNIDAHKGFQKVAENSDSPELKNYFKEKAMERQRFVQELKQEIILTGEEAKANGSLTGDAHRTWIDIKSFFSADTDETVLEEAIRGEKAAVEEYHEVLKHPISPAISTVLKSQLRRIENGLNTIKTLEDLKN